MPGIGAEADVVISFIVVTGLAAVYEFVRARSEERLKLSLVTDELTRTWNRRKFNEALEMETVRARRYARPFGLILFDVDDFKRLNDSRGHPEGDRVLRTLTDIVRKNIRDTDILARLGGDEFAILAPETASTDSSDGALTLAQRLRRTVEAFDFEMSMPVSITLGVATFQEGDTEQTIVKRADDALYRAKKAGRNRVVAIA